ncbi:MAG: DUF167 domain-containing protein [Bacteroidia bacterium]|nr:DUF167 domain-containing protein [Bacteroidia bacterium]
MPHTSKYLLKVIAKPHAHHLKHHWLDNTTLKVDIPAPPENNQANALLVSYLSKLLQVPENSIYIKSGKNSKHKFVLIPMSLDKIKEKINQPH